MKISIAAAGLGLLLLGSGTAFAQAAPAMPGPLGPDSNAAAAAGRDQQEGFTHVMSNLQRQPEAPSKGAVRKITAADATVGAPLRDINGLPIGKIAQVDPDGLVVDTGQVKVKVPIESFGKDNTGLLLGTTAAKFNDLVAKAHAQSAAADAAAAAAAAAQPRPATAADVVTGAALRDIDGKPVGKITAVSADGATLDTGKTKVKLPLDVFGVDKSGLMIAITAQKLDDLIAQSEAAAGKK
jgi:hypothetical protein